LLFLTNVSAWLLCDFDASIFARSLALSIFYFFIFVTEQQSVYEREYMDIEDTEKHHHSQIPLKCSWKKQG